MTQLLDDHKFEEKQKASLKPSKKTGILGLFIFLTSLGYQIGIGATSESNLVVGSYFWMPFFIFGISGFIVRPQKAFLLGILTIPITFIFYELIWPAL